MASQQPHNHKKAATILLKPCLLGLICLLPHALPTIAYAKKVVEQPATSTEARQMIGSGEGSCAGQIGSPSKLTLPIGKSTLINLPETLASRSIGDPGVLQSKLISAKTLYLLGVNVGSTNMIIQGKSGSCTIIDIVVTLDPDALQQTLAELIPEEKNIKVTAALDSLILSGNVEDAITANRAVDIAQAYVRRPVFAVNANTDGGNMQQNQQQQNQQGQQRQSQNNDSVNPRIINMLSVSAQQQVMLEVKIAEVSKSLLDKLGVDLVAGKINGNSSFFYNILPNLVGSLVTPITGGRVNPRFSENPNIGATTGSNDSFRSILVDAEKRDGLVKILAEPSIMAISGQEGSFLAGGRIFIPVAQNNNGGGATITLEEKEFGVGVKFTPTVLAGGRINLKVAPEVSELNREGIGINATGFGGTAILPAFTSRKASTTVQLLDGQSFAIGGLIRNNTTANIKAFPILGELPIIGALFRSTDFQNDKTELIFIVTPHLVKPLPLKGYELPTDRHADPSRTDLFLNGKLEGNPKPEKPKPSDSKSTDSKPIAKPEDNNAGFDLR